MQAADVTPVNGVTLDSHDRPITPSRLRRAMNLNIAVGAMGMAWYAVCSAQQVIQVFFKNHLHATDSELGLLVAVAGYAAPFHLAAIFIYGRLTNRKHFWVAAHILHRLLGYVLAGVAVYTQMGGNTQLGINILIVASAVSWVLMTISAAGWWSWMADLIPENIRGTFFGRRAVIVHFTNMLWFFGIMLSLDYLKGAKDEHVLWIYAVVFAIGGTLGILDIALHAFIPEPKRHPGETNIGWREFFEPVKNRNFMRFSVAIGLFGFAIGVWGPFLAPYITADPGSMGGGLGAPNKWLGIMFVVTSVMLILTVTAWGILMDRFGRKPTVVLGALFPLSWIGYLFLTPNNYIYILPFMALLGGLLSPGYWNGAGQLMLTLTPQKNRTTFVCWHNVVAAVIGAEGPVVGGVLKDAIEQPPHHAWLGPPIESLKQALLGMGLTSDVWGIHITSFHVVGLLSLALCVPCIFLLSRIREGSERPVGFVVSRLATPGVFRTFLNLGSIASPASSRRAARSLRTMDGISGHLAEADVLKRLDDADPEVRQEAARALGRIGSDEAVDALIQRLRDPNSTIRPDAARALGQIGFPAAVPALIEALSSGSVELEEACAQALGAIGDRAARTRLKRLLGEKRTERVFVSIAEAMSKLGIIEAGWEIVPRIHETANPVLRRQLAIAMGNLLGNPGEFYAYLTGETSHQGARLGRLFRGARRAVRSFRPVAANAAERAALKDLEADLPRIRGLMEAQAYGPAIEAIHEQIRSLVRLTTKRELEDEVALEYALARDVKLGLGFWFVQRIRSLMDRIKDTELLHADALLALYFLSAYRLPPESRAEKE
jgi:HEAT repeat protein/MFS family permease